MKACEPLLYLAPMAGVTDSVFRRLCRAYGATGLVTEMVSAKAICYGDRHTLELLGYGEEEKPLTVQLFGHEPEILARAAEKMAALGFAGIDLNAGCPAPKITRNGEGSSLLKDPQLAARCVEAMVKASPLPVSVKFRKGVAKDHDVAEEFARCMEQAGACLLTIHGKTAAQMYAPSVDLDCIRRTVQAVKIPVIGNGEVEDGESARKMLELGCAGVMVGRAACGDPWVFTCIAAQLKGEQVPPISPAERMRVAMAHVHGLVKEKGAYIGVREARKHLAWYMRSFRGAAALRARINNACTEEEMAAICEEACAMQESAL